MVLRDMFNQPTDNALTVDQLALRKLAFPKCDAPPGFVAFGPSKLNLAEALQHPQVSLGPLHSPEPAAPACSRVLRNSAVSSVAVRPSRK